MIRLNFILRSRIYSHSVIVKVLLVNMNRSEQSKFLLEGPILISTTKIEGDEVMNHLKVKIMEAVENGHLENAENTRVLILSGSHGDANGHSGLTDIEQLKDSDDKFVGSITTQFYEGDCRRVGLKPIKPRLDIQKLPLTKTAIPDIMKKMEKLDLRFHKNSYLSDDTISKITFQVVSVAYYHKNEEKFIDDVQMFDPKVLALAWCYSMKSDVSLALRQKGILARMVIEHDLKEICKKPNANLDDKQSEIIEKVVNEKPQNIILWGSSGTGKTILLTQALGIKASHLKRQNVKVKIIISCFGFLGVNPKKLMEDMESKYITHMKLEEGQFVIFRDLCRGMYILYFKDIFCSL